MNKQSIYQPRGRLLHEDDFGKVYLTGGSIEIIGPKGDSFTMPIRCWYNLALADFEIPRSAPARDERRSPEEPRVTKMQPQP